MYEPGTHWDFSHQPMVPCTPPEFLKMASHPPLRPLLHRTCVLVLELALLSLFSLLGQAPQPPLSHCRTRCKGIVRKNPLKVTVNDERKTPHCVACGERESNCSRNSGTRHHRRVSSHLQFGYFGPNHVRRRCIVLFGCQSVGVHQ